MEGITFDVMFANRRIEIVKGVPKIFRKLTIGYRTVTKAIFYSGPNAYAVIPAQVGPEFSFLHPGLAARELVQFLC